MSSSASARPTERTAIVRKPPSASPVTSLFDAGKKLKVFERRRVQTLARFKEIKDEEELALPYQRLYGFAPNGQDIFKKTSVALNNGHSLDIITRQGVTNDTLVIWHTNGDTVKAALRNGILNPDALTAKVIKTLGKYNLKVMSRALLSNIVSNNAEPKNLILEELFSRISVLQPLERCLNQPVKEDSPKKAFDEVVKCINAFIESDTDGSYPEDIKAAKQLKDLFVRHDTADSIVSKKWLIEEGNRAISLFIKERIILALREAQAANQDLTYRTAWLRGDLNNCIEDAVKVVRDYRQDFHTPVTEKHQLKYGKDDKVAVESEYHVQHNAEDFRNFMMVVSVLDGDSKLDLEHRIVTSSTKWSNTGTEVKSYDTRSTGQVIGHAIWNMVPMGALNLLETTLFGKHASWAYSQMYHLEEYLDKTYKDHKTYEALMQRIKVDKTHVSTSIGMLLHKTISNVVIEGAIKGSMDLVQRILGAFKTLAADYEEGHRNRGLMHEAQLEEILQKFHQSLLTITEQSQRINAELKKEFDEEKNQHLPRRIEYARPDVSLTPYNSHGLLNVMANGFVHFVDFFEHNMLAKHPFTSLVGMYFAMHSFEVFLMENSGFPDWYVNFLKEDLGYIWAKDPASAAIASSFTYYKLVSAGIELGLHGPDSWIVTAGKKFLDDPAFAIVAGTLSWAVGYSLLYRWEIPWVSEKLREHVGNVPLLAEIFGGVKVLAGFYHVLTATKHKEGHAAELNEDGLVSRCTEIYTEVMLDHDREISLEEKERFAEAIRTVIKEMKPKAELQDVSTAPSGASEQKIYGQQPAESDVVRIPADATEVKLENGKGVDNMRFAILLKMAVHLNELEDLDPVLKRQLSDLLPTLMPTPEGVLALRKALYPSEYAPKAPLRQFVGRVGTYGATVFRCAASVVTHSGQPWEQLGSLVVDDIYSTTDAGFKVLNKVTELICNRFPRVVSDVVFNGIIARLEAWITGSKRIGDWNHTTSAEYDMFQERVHASTTGRVISALSLRAAPADPVESIQQALVPAISNTTVSEGLRFRVRESHKIVPQSPRFQPGAVAAAAASTRSAL